MTDLKTLNSASTYPPLNIPPANPEELKRGTEVVIRYFYADSLPGRKSKVLRKYQSLDGRWFVRVKFGVNRGGQSLLKSFPLSVLGLATAQ
jgi:hypothetical protein